MQHLFEKNYKTKELYKMEELELCEVRRNVFDTIGNFRETILENRIEEIDSHLFFEASLQLKNLVEAEMTKRADLQDIICGLLKDMGYEDVAVPSAAEM